MDEHLADARLVRRRRPSALADICLFAYTHVADEADFDLELYPTSSRWMERVMLIRSMSRWTLECLPRRRLQA